MGKTVLVVDDAGFDRTIIIALLNQSGFEIIGEASSGKEGVQLAKELNPDIITLDKLMPDLDGMDALKEIRALKIKSKIVMISGDELDSIKSSANELGVHHFLIKPVSRNELIATFSEL